MTIEYIRIQRKITVGANPGMKFLARIKRGRKVQMNEIYKDITDLSSLSRGDVKSVIDNFMLVITKYLKDGKNVDLEEFGEFQVGINSKAVNTLEEVTAETITKANVIFRMGRELRKELEYTPKVIGSLEAKGYQPRNQ